jgi:hypothetical protein
MSILESYSTTVLMPYANKEDQKAASKRWYEKNHLLTKARAKTRAKVHPEKIKKRPEYKHGWYVKNRDQILQSRVIYRAENSDQIKETFRTWYERKRKDPEFVLLMKKRGRLYRESLRFIAMSMLGGSCTSCGESEIDFLVVDHVNNDGAEHRKELRSLGKGTSISVYIEIRDGVPSREYQLLCWNCNYKKIPKVLHSSTRPKIIDSERAYKFKLKSAVFKKLGSSCFCCGTEDKDTFTIDHVNNDGSAHRKSQSRLKILREIRDSSDTSGYQILCWNCNCSKGLYGSCPHTRNP